jgi:hypothetical protein
VVKDRRLLLGPFTHSGQALPQTWYEIDVYCYFNPAWDQPAHVLALVGPRRREAGWEPRAGGGPGTG